ncbi:sigma-70 family RNA polymerase sigma factor [Tautonia marina]|uniref:sigma-70 family RNA polymerase sigma factor n=1 Tax=Tautonia marina TaxID=2653855 RepID=UPI001260B59B|nr:sigma-70 family RNA polymerase sigma factor [Tautonia marina]
MAGNRSKMAGSDWRTLFRLGTMGDWPDGRLLDRFLQQPDDGGDAAFETLVRRHGPMVWRVCRGVLSDRHAAEDAYQATFLVLAERAASIRRRDSVASWLYGVARRISLRSLADARSRRDSERRAARPEAVAVPPLADAPGDLEALLRELDRLPAHYRGPIALHDLGGCSYEEVASRLGCPVGTIKARLNRGRALLRSRLSSRGASPTLPAPAALAGIVPNALTERTVRSAVSLSLGRAATGAGVASLSPTVAALSRGVIHAMFLAKLKTTAAVLVLGGSLCAAGAAAVVVAQGSNPGNPSGSTSREPSPVPNRQAPALSAEAIDQRAEAIAASLDDPERRAEVLLRLGQARSRRGQSAEALEVLRLARDSAKRIPVEALGNSRHPITRIASAQAEAGDRDAALESFRAAIPIIEAMDNHRQRSEWTRLIAMWGKWIGREGIRAVADPYLAFVERSGLGEPEATLIRVGILTRSGEVARAIRDVKAAAHLQFPEGAPDRRQALLAIAESLLPEDDEFLTEILAEIDTTIRAEGELQPERAEQELHSNRIDLSTLAQALDRHGRFDDAIETMIRAEGELQQERVEQETWRRNGDLSTLAQVLARHGRFDDAIETIRRIEMSGPSHMTEIYNHMKLFLLALVAQAQLDGGDQEGARETLGEARESIESIERHELRSFPIRVAAEEYLRLGEIEEAEALAAELVERGDADSNDWLKLHEARRASGDDLGARAALRNGLERAEAELRTIIIRESSRPDRSNGWDPLLATTNRIVLAASNLARIRLKLDGTRAAIETAAQLPEKARDEFLPNLAALLAEDGELDAARGVLQSIDDPELRDRVIVRVALAMPGPLETEPPAGPEPDEVP